MQTIIPALFRKVDLPWRRERIELLDGDFLDFDWFTSGNAKELPTLALITHGLEGDSRRPYVAGMARYLRDHFGWDALAWNYRGCSGEPNRLARFYHLGETGDQDFVVKEAIRRGYEKIILIGFSAGANVILKYLGEVGEDVVVQIKAAAAISAPMDMAGCAIRMESGSSRFYNRRFTRQLLAKVAEKNLALPGILPELSVGQVKTLRHFDDAVTAPLHGFESSSAYYEHSSSLHYLESIRIPTLILSAMNDPLFSPSCYPMELAEKLHWVTMHFPKKGGHVGFSPAWPCQKTYWSEWRVGEFFKQLNVNC